jgi:hypothetical protein
MFVHYVRNHTTKWKNLEKQLDEELFVDQLHSLFVPTVVRTTDIKTELVCGASTDIR